MGPSPSISSKGSSTATGVVTSTTAQTAPDSGNDPLLPGAILSGHIECYLVQDALQECLYGNVYRGVGLETGDVVAIKLLIKSQVSYREEDRELPETPLAEVFFAPLLHGHPNVFGIREVFEVELFHFVVSDLAQGEDLLELLKLHPRGVPGECVRYFMRQAAEAIQHAHSRCVAFQDFSLENCLLFVDNEGSYRVRVCDPGQAVRFRLDSEGNELPTPYVGCIGKKFRPPEVFTQQAYLASRVDSWCLGWSAFYLLFATEIICSAGKDDRDIRWQLFRANRFEELFGMLGVSESLNPVTRDFVVRLMHPQPQYRMTVSEALHHPFLSNYVPTSITPLQLKGPGGCFKALRHGAGSRAVELWRSLRTTNAVPVQFIPPDDDAVIMKREDAAREKLKVCPLVPENYFKVYAFRYCCPDKPSGSLLPALRSSAETGSESRVPDGATTADFSGGSSTVSESSSAGSRGSRHTLVSPIVAQGASNRTFSTQPVDPLSQCSQAPVLEMRQAADSSQAGLALRLTGAELSSPSTTLVAGACHTSLDAPEKTPPDQTETSKPITVSVVSHGPSWIRRTSELVPKEGDPPGLTTHYTPPVSAMTSDTATDVPGASTIGTTSATNGITTIMGSSTIGNVETTSPRTITGTTSVTSVVTSVAARDVSSNGAEASADVAAPANTQNTTITSTTATISAPIATTTTTAVQSIQTSHPGQSIQTNQTNRPAAQSHRSIQPNPLVQTNQQTARPTPPTTPKPTESQIRGDDTKVLAVVSVVDNKLDNVGIYENNKSSTGVPSTKRNDLRQDFLVTRIVAPSNVQRRNSHSTWSARKVEDSTENPRESTEPPLPRWVPQVQRHTIGLTTTPPFDPWGPSARPVPQTPNPHERPQVPQLSHIQNNNIHNYQPVQTPHLPMIQFQHASPSQPSARGMPGVQPQSLSNQLPISQPVQQQGLQTLPSLQQHIQHLPQSVPVGQGFNQGNLQTTGPPSTQNNNLLSIQPNQGHIQLGPGHLQGPIQGSVGMIHGGSSPMQGTGPLQGSTGTQHGSGLMQGSGPVYGSGTIQGSGPFQGSGATIQTSGSVQGSGATVQSSAAIVQGAVSGLMQGPIYGQIQLSQSPIANQVPIQGQNWISGSGSISGGSLPGQSPIAGQGPIPGQQLAQNPIPGQLGQQNVIGGQPGQQLPGQPGQQLLGQPGQQLLGQPGQQLPGQPGQQLPSQQLPGQPGQQLPGQPGQQLPGQPGQQLPGQPGQQLPGQQLPGQQLPGQPGQQLPGQPGQQLPGQPGQQIPGPNILPGQAHMLQQGSPAINNGAEFSPAPYLTTWQGNNRVASFQREISEELLLLNQQQAMLLRGDSQRNARRPPAWLAASAAPIASIFSGGRPAAIAESGMEEQDERARVRRGKSPIRTSGRRGDRSRRRHDKSGGPRSRRREDNNNIHQVLHNTKTPAVPPPAQLPYAVPFVGYNQQWNRTSYVGRQ